MEEWGYIWAHRLLEDVYIRPNFDVHSIINTFKDSVLQQKTEDGECEDSLKRLTEL